MSGYAAKKLDGEEKTTILLNGHKAIPSDRKPNTSEVNFHTCFLKEVWIEGFGMTKASMLEHGVGLTFAIIPQVEVRCIFIINLHVLGLRDEYMVHKNIYASLSSSPYKDLIISSATLPKTLIFKGDNLLKKIEEKREVKQYIYVGCMQVEITQEAPS